MRVRAKRAFAFPHPTRYARHLLPSGRRETRSLESPHAMRLILPPPFGHIFSARGFVKGWTKIRTRILIVVIRAVWRQPECNLWRSLKLGDDARKARQTGTLIQWGEHRLSSATWRFILVRRRPAGRAGRLNARGLGPRALRPPGGSTLRRFSPASFWRLSASPRSSPSICGSSGISRFAPGRARSTCRRRSSRSGSMRR